MNLKPVGSLKIMTLVGGKILHTVLWDKREIKIYSFRNLSVFHAHNFQVVFCICSILISLIKLTNEIHMLHNFLMLFPISIISGLFVSHGL